MATLNEYLEKEERDKLEELITHIKNNDVILFAGTGISYYSGFSLWDGTISELKKLANVSNEYKGDSYEIVDYCEDNLGEQYYKFIKEKFGTQRNTRLNENTHYLVNTKFAHIITTNFDCSLFNTSNSELISRLITYPALLPIDEKRTLFHLHGRAFLTKKEMMADDASEKEISYLKSIIFGKRAYHKHYEELDAIKNFLFNVLSQFSIFFVGFSMKDKMFRKTFDYINIRAEKFSKELSLTRGPAYLPPPSYILLDRNETKNISDDLNSSRIKIISYNNIDGSYMGISEILSYLQRSAPYRIYKDINEFESKSRRQ